MFKFLPLTLLATVASVSSVIAQNDFRPGYVVPTSGDTIRGLIDNRGTVTLARQIRFKASAEGSVTEYAPAQLRAAGFTPGQNYESLSVDGGQAFLAVLAKGPVSLYRYSDPNDRQHYYVLSATRPLTELLQRDTVQEAMVNGAAKRVKVRAYPFRKVLASSFTGCYTITGDLARAELKESTLIRLFQSYYSCQGGASTGTIRTRRESKLRFSVVGGLNQGSYLFAEYKNTSVDIKSKQRPIVGIGLSYTPGSFNEKFAISMEVLHFKNHTIGYYERMGGGTNTFGTAKVTVDLNWTSISVPAMFRYTFAPNRAITPFFQVGPQVSYRLSPKASYTIREDLNNGDKFQVTNELAVKQLSVYGVIGAGAQISLGHLGTIRPEVRYMATDKSSDTGQLSNENILNFLLTYSFGK
ncbi:porin family protein [Hymenobacter metallicola]|uniref:PorT family protein n=1 Tax=Hymenobacter metallicola TaxID=2563114 RepID=A0A4Z0PZ11_9BACT|nr:porin family protein [Hymenobacter metallicola]TGE22957.1 PorT family protein [Hymenobacter metallicola]